MSRWSSQDDISCSGHDTDPKHGVKRISFANISTFLWLCCVSLTLIIATYILNDVAATGLISNHGDTTKQNISTETSTIPDYFQTSPQIYPGPTATAKEAPFLAQSYPGPFSDSVSFVPNSPLQTTLPIYGGLNNTNVFALMGQLSPYNPSPGFGCNEYPLPPGANISQVHILHRHGSRYPTDESSVPSFGTKVNDLTKNGTAQWSGSLTFLNSWNYNLGMEILVPKGRQELFDSGVLHYYNYGKLYDPATKILARTTTQDRMLKSAENFMAGFFGLEWTQNATLEVQIEQSGLNTSLAGYLQCLNANGAVSTGGIKASLDWQELYLAAATKRLRAMSGNYDWTISDSYNAQTLCPYETVAFGYSPWCALFTVEEWHGFEYSIDLQFHGSVGFASPVGRAVGIGYVQEMLARLRNHLYQLEPGSTNVNYTLDTMESTFPLNQTLYLDFSHDTNILSILTALGLRQFAEDLPAADVSANRSLVVSHITPFGARVVFEIIRAPRPVKANRPLSQNLGSGDHYDSGEATSYVHLLINQRTLPLYRSYPACGKRDDGWCDLHTFLAQLDTTLAAAQYQYSCFGNYTVVPYGNITDGTPITRRNLALGIALGGTGSRL